MLSVKIYDKVVKLIPLKKLFIFKFHCLLRFVVFYDRYVANYLRSLENAGWSKLNQLCVVLQHP